MVGSLASAVGGLQLSALHNSGRWADAEHDTFESWHADLATNETGLEEFSGFIGVSGFRSTFKDKSDRPRGKRSPDAISRRKESRNHASAVDHASLTLSLSQNCARRTFAEVVRGRSEYTQVNDLIHSSSSPPPSGTQLNPDAPSWCGSGLNISLFDTLGYRETELCANDQQVLLVPHPSNVYATSPPSFGSGSDLGTVASLEEIVAARVSKLCDHLCTTIDEQFASLRMELASIRETIATQGSQSSFDNAELSPKSIDKPTESSAVGMIGEFAKHVTVCDAVESNVEDGKNVAKCTFLDCLECAPGSSLPRGLDHDDLHKDSKPTCEAAPGSSSPRGFYRKRNDLSLEESCGGRVLRDIRAGTSLDFALKVIELNVQQAGKVLNSQLVHKFVSCQLEAIEPLTKLRDSRMSLLKESGKNAKQIRKDPEIMELTRKIDELYLYNDEKGFAIVSGAQQLMNDNATAHKRGVCVNTP
jgi:hypothetical protein